MSRVLKSSQIIVDKNKYRLPIKDSISNIAKKRTDDISNSESNEGENLKERLKEEENLISKKIEEMNLLYEQRINDARKEENRIISEAYEKSKKIMEQSRKEGFEQGKKEGFKEGKLQADSIIQEALTIKRQTEANMRSLVNGLEEEIIKLTISTVEKILNKKVEEEYDVILNLIKIGLEKCAFTENLILRVSVDDYDFVLSSKDKILALSQNINDIIIKQDKSLSKGSCIIDTQSGSVDSSIKTQFDQVKEMFEELLKSE
ncbi:FliH/SctL family protein [Paramaledivibacter caminithermalis]|uniref:Flagellar assembly protein FliH n=1 Tax=Paramaledivibacter caminithermalis (strain DSM 15212 / CIP 107654 / DViRD3) TaxID=1121301 RepID=A0A1M6N814_PARC5|nr:FliH/SctL family protein [Paramaledivibacter caminithermalis]SHJ91797.1 flagellar assembly protein FliH [Paramaledivibacter caminithermalis DSM 15212]